MSLIRRFPRRREALLALIRGFGRCPKGRMSLIPPSSQRGSTGPGSVFHSPETKKSPGRQAPGAMWFRRSEYGYAVVEESVDSSDADSLCSAVSGDSSDADGSASDFSPSTSTARRPAWRMDGRIRSASSSSPASR